MSSKIPSFVTACKRYLFSDGVLSASAAASHSRRKISTQHLTHPAERSAVLKQLSAVQKQRSVGAAQLLLTGGRTADRNRFISAVAVGGHRWTDGDAPTTSGAASCSTTTQPSSWGPRCSPVNLNTLVATATLTTIRFSAVKSAVAQRLTVVAIS